ncbi:glycosyltransferase family 4 protein [Neptuniibacter sp. SY11_33]|uniref:glycosyltransferase family 4 protein n=1 Tax=Neptuniibacter sp. SY11_33 TaxID=3398215 RepID=UPI0039F45BC5
MKLIYVSKYFDVPSYGETGSRGFHLCRELSRKGHDVTILASKPPHLYAKEKLKRIYTKEVFEALDVIFIKTIGFEKKRSIKRIVTWVEFEIKVLYYLLVKHRDADVIVASSLSLFSIVTALLMKLFCGTRVVFEVRDIWPLSIIEQGGFSAKNPFMWLLSKIERLGYRFSDHIVGTMPNLIEHVKGIGINHAPVSCIPMGVSDEHIASLEMAESCVDSIENLNFVPEGKFLIGYAGGFGTANALDYIFESAKCVTDPRVHFVLVGDGNLKSHYESIYGGLENVTIGPRLRKQDVGKFASKCDLMVVSTNPAKIWKYGHSLNKIVDYMLAARPSLFIYDGYDDMVSAAKCGFFINTFKPSKIALEIDRIAKTPKGTLAEMGEAGRRWLLSRRKYSVLAGNYESLLETILTADKK